MVFERRGLVGLRIFLYDVVLTATTMLVQPGVGMDWKHLPQKETFWRSPLATWLLAYQFWINSIAVIGKLHYYVSLTGEWAWDGSIHRLQATGYRKDFIILGWLIDWLLKGASLVHTMALTSVSCSPQPDTVKLQDNGYGTSASGGIPVYSPCNTSARTFIIFYLFFTTFLSK